MKTVSVATGQERRDVKKSARRARAPFTKEWNAMLGVATYVTSRHHLSLPKIPSGPETRCREENHP